VTVNFSLNFKTW